ncbi:MAG: NifU family protein [Sphingomonadales bacterium]|jgi:Fe-S cluster biogenesis protein NfuA
MFIETEQTPNPLTLMFRPGKPVTGGDGVDIANADAASVSPLATALFALGDVDRVFLGHDFVSVTRNPAGADWPALKPQILGVLVDHYASGAPLFTGELAQAGFDDDPEDADIVLQIRELLETRVRPQVAEDGGDIVYRGFRNGTVFLEMQGACSGCPSSTMTLKMGIESLLKYYVPEVLDVRAV